MKKCWSCAEEIQGEAVACRFCGAKQGDPTHRPLFEFLRERPKGQHPPNSFQSCTGCLGGIIAILVVLAVVGSMMDSSSSSAPDNQVENASATQVEMQPPLEVTARELSSAFDANEVSAMQKYGASPLLIAGKIASVDLDIGDEPVVSLETGEFFNVRLHFKSQNGAATAALSKGQTAVFKCVGLREAMGMAILDDCVIEPAARD